MIGPLLAIVFDGRAGRQFHAVFWIAVVPASYRGNHCSGVREPERHRDSREVRRRRLRAPSLRLSHGLLAGGLRSGDFTLARFSEAFLLLRAQSVGLGAGFVPIVMVVMNVVYDVFGVAGRCAVGPRRPLSVADGEVLLSLIVADLVLALGK